MKYLSCILIMSFAFSKGLKGQGYQYTMAWPAPQSHEYLITLTALPAAGEATVFQLPAWRPGRYILQDYAAGISHFEAMDRGGRPLGWHKRDVHSWQVENPEEGQITIRYRFYANVMDAGSSVLSLEQAYFNGVNLFMHVEGRYDEPCTLSINGLPASWKAATALMPAEGRTDVFTASNYHDLVDAPTIFSPTLRSFNFSVDGVDYYVHFQGIFNAGDAGEALIKKDFPKIISEQAALFGGVPMDAYHFIFQLVPQRMGHAVEHKYSSCYALSDVVAASAESLPRIYGVTSHEFFHLWNVKRIRPAALWPYDYQTIPYTGLHWWTEGVTDYYTNLTLVRAGLMSRENYLGQLSNQITYFESSYANSQVSPHAASFDSWLARSDYENPFLGTSYYALGSRVGLLLDLKIRTLTEGQKSLDDVFTFLYQNYYQKDLGVPEDGIREACETVSGHSFQEFFDRHVTGTGATDYPSLFEPFGLRVEKTFLAMAGWGHAGLLRSEQTPDGIQVNMVVPDSDASRAGLGDGMMVVEVNGEAAGTFDPGAFFSQWEEGKKLDLKVRRAGREETLTLYWSGKNNLYDYRVTPIEMRDDGQKKMLEAWLASKVK